MFIIALLACKTTTTATPEDSVPTTDVSCDVDTTTIQVSFEGIDAPASGSNVSLEIGVYCGEEWVDLGIFTADSGPLDVPANADRVEVTSGGVGPTPSTTPPAKAPVTVVVVPTSTATRCPSPSPANGPPRAEISPRSSP